MKKFLLVACMILVLVGCGKKENETGKNQIIQIDKTTDVVNISSKYKEETFTLLNEKDNIKGALMSDDNFMILLESLIMIGEDGISSLDEKSLSLRDIAKIYKEVGTKYENEYELETFLIRYFPDKIGNKEEIRKEYKTLYGSGVPSWGYVRLDRTSLDNDILTVEVEYLWVGDEGSGIYVQGYSNDEEKYDKTVAQIEKDWEWGRLDADKRYVIKFIVDKENREFIPIHKQEKSLKMYTEYTQEEMKKIYNSDNKSEEVLIFSDIRDWDLDGESEKIEVISRFASVSYYDNKYKWYFYEFEIESDIPQYVVRVSNPETEGFIEYIRRYFVIQPIIDEVEFIFEDGRNKLRIESGYRSSGEVNYVSFIDGEFVIETDTMEHVSSVGNALFKYNIEKNKSVLTNIYEARDGASNADMYDYDYTEKVLIIPNYIEEIRKGAFDKCKSEYVVIPKSVEKIEEGAIPEGVKILRRAPIFNLETIEMLDETGDINKLLESDSNLMVFIDLISDNCEDFDINEGISINDISTILEIVSNSDSTKNNIDVSKELDELIELYYPDKKAQKDELEKMSKEWFGFDNVMHYNRVVNSKLEGDILTIQYEELHDYEDIGLEELRDEKSNESTTGWKNGTIEADYKAIIKFKVDEENMIFIPIFKKEIYNKWVVEISINE